MGFLERLRRLQNAAKDHMVEVVCTVCGEETQIRPDPQFELVTLQWRRHQLGTDELPSDTPPDVRWILQHPHSGLSIVDKRTGESALFPKHYADLLRQREDAD